MPIDHENVHLFLDELRYLLKKYQTRISSAEAIGCLQLMSDDISRQVREFNAGPHPLS